MYSGQSFEGKKQYCQYFEISYVILVCKFEINMTNEVK